ncbi:nuclear transport factor 2 family protein [uncultured Clostridium sp.]|uniref:nuclear transport factor 2 family protein n=1 Tax=uncultured Clostridium sp. TaxID=59620 RepID=UPI0025ECBB38|nr:nuclear transport factor 2 family protein [uncultured Clostridium sp.]
MEEIIKKYFQCWLEKNKEGIKEVFSDDIVYSECYGPEYRGINQLFRWFKEWNDRGTVLQWDINQIISSDKTTIAEWYFKCEYDGKIEGFNGVTIAKFNDSMKICNLKEFQSKAEHYYPYGE